MQGKETSEAREKEEQDLEEDEVVERVCRRPGCGKVRAQVMQRALGRPYYLQVSRKWWQG